MDLEKALKTGNEVRIRTENNTFVSTIDEMMGDDSFTILVPVKQGETVQAKVGDIFSVSCVTERGLYMFEAKVMAVELSPSVALLHLKETGDVHRVQRRQAFRVRESVDVNARKKAAGPSSDGKWVKTNTIDIAELGMLLKFTEDCEDGQEIELSLKLNILGKNEIIPNIKGRVVRCIPTRNKEYGFLLGLQFDELPEKARDALIKFVVLSQRSKLTYKTVKKPR